ncbi:hypothetical protein [Aestuariicoccus sp. MJ-SS9]|uniref:hypothetical protein n=1 Tax=Aestuariicoccus sp. MJ-SS9 TaxID=3079855 RepID=UPI002915C420|nr:hypothetical protein [Aestuariicoccus sp. MJ-SS9]MDU8914167.1 hypothetical protein [Aestuariicoccus sp. MJ-SS9]
MACKNVDSQSIEELANLLEEIGLSLHAKNRVAGGESNFVWYLAEGIRSVSQLAARLENDRKLHQLFGDAYHSGTLAEEAEHDYFFALLRDAFSASK